MTITNTAISNSPLSNPFNAHSVNYTTGFFKTNYNAKLPEPIPFDPSSFDDGLHVPESGVPMGSENRFVVPASTMQVGNLVINKHTMEIIGNTESANNDEWAKPRTINHPAEQIETIPTIDSSYWENAQQKSAALNQTLSDKQKELLKQVDNGEFFKLTKLVDVNESR